MKTQIVIPALGLLALGAYAQPVASREATFQFVTTSGEGVGWKVLTPEGMSGKAVVGRPLSATEERHTLQTLGDGTRIENTETDKFYRDGQGRTRIERSSGAILIQDPVQGSSAEINGNSKMVRRSTFKTTMPSIGVAVSSVDADKLKAEMKAQAGADISKEIAIQMGKATAEAAARNSEDLGYQSVNGVTAQGFRNTTTIPAGKIGNDRPIQIVSERWYSNDLQMNVKTVNSDPRFGETTYQLTNILQGAPDPSLFQVPTESRQQ